uniref:C-type lectin domain-containing protein n=1 Tax=Periophthalmus magnuspinnatus TaxID=409849 RepID=A0A3B4AT35_9GOBI
YFNVVVPLCFTFGSFSGFKVALCFHYLSFYLINSSLNWFEARDYCAQLKYSLASIYSTKEYNMLKSYPGGAWIGLSDIQDFWKEGLGRSSNSWRWSGNETLAPDGYQNWTLHQPDNYNATEYCVLMKNGQWTDGFCEISLPFICFSGKLSKTKQS